MKRRTNKFDSKPLGEAIKAAREEKGESRTVVSEAVGISANELVCIENRGQHPTIQVLYELVTRYGISVDKYFLGISEAPIAPAATATKNSKRGELDKILEKLSDDEIDVIVKTAKAIMAIIEKQGGEDKAVKTESKQTEKKTRTTTAKKPRTAATNKAEKKKAPAKTAKKASAKKTSSEPAVTDKAATKRGGRKSKTSK